MVFPSEAASLSALTDESSAVLVRYDGAHRVLAWPSSAERLFGVRADAVLGRPLAEVIPFFADGVGEHEAWCRRADGQAIRVQAVPVVPGDGEAAQFGLLVRDVTRRYQRDEERRQAEARLARLTARLQGLVPFSFELPDGELSVGLADLLGHREGGVHALLSSCRADQRGELGRRLEQVLVDRAGFDMEIPLLDGRWLQLVGVIVGEPRPRLVGTALDVSRRHLDDSSRADVGLLEAVFAASRDGLAVIDEDGRLAQVSRAFAQLFGTSSFALTGAPWQAVLSLPSAELPERGIQHALIGRRADNSTFPLECCLVGVDEVDSRVLCVVRDVTESSLAERRLVESSELLQRRIGQDLHDGLGQLLTGTAFLAKGLESSVPASHQAQAHRVVELVNQAISRVRSLARGLIPVPSEEESLEAALRNVLSESAKLLGLECRFERKDSLGGVRPAVVSQLCLIAREAITNAVRHGHAARIVITVGRSGSRSLMLVEDDGVGIRPPRELVEGLGLRSMRARASTIGGNLEVSRGEVGTVVRCWWHD